VTVKQLIAKLEKLDPDRVVVMRKDGEGNGHSPLSNLGDCIYRPDSTWSGDVYPEDANEDDHGYTKQKGDKKAVVLCPVN
jgi:hypothetical protein